MFNASLRKQVPCANQLLSVQLQIVARLVCNRITYLDAVLQRVARQIAIDESRTSSNTFQSKPQKQVARAVWSIKRNDFTLVDPQILQKPVAYSLHILIELSVSPPAVLKDRFQE